jgi:hypothetical protein
MALSQFRAGSGAYQNVVPITVQNSITIGASAISLQTLSTGQLAQGSLVNMAGDSLYLANWANPGATSTSAFNGATSGVIIQDAWISANGSGSTGGLQNNLYMWMQNVTGGSITVPSATQINLLQF